MQKITLNKIAKIYNGNSINSKVKAEKYSAKCDGWSYIGTKDVAFDGSVDYENGIMIPFGETSFKIAPAQSVFVCSEGGSAGRKTAYIDRDVCFGNKLYAIVNDKNLFSPKYIFYYTRYREFFEQFQSLMNGIIGGVSSKKFGEIEIPLPPLPEQERIVQKIEELFADLDKGIEELEQAKAKLKIYHQAVLKDAFDPFAKLNPITDFFDISGGLTKNSRRNDFETKLSYLRVANVYYNFLDLTEVKKIGVQPTEIERTRLQMNDLLFVEGNGSKEQIGRVAVWDGSIENCLHQNHIIKGRPNGKMLSLYALFYLISKNGRDQILSVASSTSGLYTLSISKVKNLKIPFCNVGEQEQIINEIEAKLSTCDKQEQVVNESLQKAENLRQSILKQAFEGRLI